MAASTYIDWALLTSNTNFLNRINVAVITYAAYILGTEGTGTAFHTNRFSWAKGAMTSPGSVAGQIAFLCATDPAVKALATPIDPAVSLTDAQIQTIVEAAINNSILKFY